MGPTGKRVLVVSSAPFIKLGGEYHAYSPYLNEMEIWARHSAEISFLCPVLLKDDGTLLKKVAFPLHKVYNAKAFDIRSLRGILAFLFYLPYNFMLIVSAMRSAGHIHLRCPGNISLIGCVAQIFFPAKIKTAKYAGNWDPRSDQPVSYKLQKFILNSTFLTRNIKVLVYGRWPGASENIVPFFTATYRESDKIQLGPKTVAAPVKFVFVGTLSPGKRPLYAIELIDALRGRGIDATLDFYGDGIQRSVIMQSISDKNLHGAVTLHGNQPADIVRNAYIGSHFAILASKSEGWPKAVAEAMFWGCVPVASKVSCVPFMLGNGGRGILLELDLARDCEMLLELINDPAEYRVKVEQSVAWSGQFTLDLFETRIQEMVRQ